MSNDYVNRTRENRVSMYLDDKELKHLNKMVDKTNLNREQFLRRMIEGVTIAEAPPAPLWQTVCLMRQAAADLHRIAVDSYLSDVADEELLQKTMDNLNTCVREITARCMVDEKGVSTHEHKPHRPSPDRER